jgi:hypothetical protein
MKLPLALALCLFAGPVFAQSKVPFVGCPSDGQLDAIEAPTGGSKNAVAPANLAGQLAFYGSEHLGVLAPRGWYCFGLYGSNGVQLLVSPDPLTGDGTTAGSIFSKNMAGPGIHLARMFGGTSGRFYVASVAARLFPLADSFVEDVIAEGIEPKEAFPKGPFPRDKTIRRSETLVEFTTPAGEDGMGTMSRLVKNGDPIQGVAILLPDEDMDLVTLQVRLPANQRGYAAAIISGIENTQGEP